MAKKTRKIKKKERMVKKKGKREKTTTTLSEKKEKASNVSEQRNPCTRYNPLSSDSNTAGQQTLTNNPRQRKNARSR